MFSLASFLLICLQLTTISGALSLPNDYIQFGGNEDESRKAAYYLSADSGTNIGPTDELKRTQRNFWKTLFKNGLFGECNDCCNNYNGGNYYGGNNQIPCTQKPTLPWHPLPLWSPLKPLFGAKKSDNYCCSNCNCGYCCNYPPSPPPSPPPYKKNPPAPWPTDNTPPAPPSYDQNPQPPPSPDNKPPAPPSYNNNPPGPPYYDNPPPVPPFYNNPPAHPSYNNTSPAPPSHDNSPPASPSFGNTLPAPPSNNNNPTPPLCYHNMPTAPWCYDNRPSAYRSYYNPPTYPSPYYNRPPSSPSSPSSPPHHNTPPSPPSYYNTLPAPSLCYNAPPNTPPFYNTPPNSWPYCIPPHDPSLYYNLPPTPSPPSYNNSGKPQTPESHNKTEQSIFEQLDPSLEPQPAHSQHNQTLDAVNDKVPQIVYQPIIFVSPQYQGKSMNNFNEEDNQELKSFINKNNKLDEAIAFDDPFKEENIEENDKAVRTIPVSNTPTFSTEEPIVGARAPCVHTAESPCLTPYNQYPQPNSAVSTVYNIISPSLLHYLPPSSMSSYTNTATDSFDNDPSKYSWYSSGSIPLNSSPVYGELSLQSPSAGYSSYSTPSRIPLSLDDQPFRACPELFTDYQRKLNRMRPYQS